MGTYTVSPAGPFAGGGVATGFCSFFFADDMVEALREAGRVAKPGAPVVIQVWGRPERFDLRLMKSVLARFRPPPPPGRLDPSTLWQPGALEDLAVMDPETMQKVEADGETLGEVMFRGNIVMKGYLHNERATEEAFAGGWFHSGDLGVMHPDGYIQLKDRSKDIIISGGENISSIEVEDVLYKHPAVAAAAVVAKPDTKWGETPCAFVETRPGASVTADDPQHTAETLAALLGGIALPVGPGNGTWSAIAPDPIGSYTYRKRLHFFASADCRVVVYPLLVTAQYGHWPEQGQRELIWVPAPKAAGMVREPELGRLLASLPRWIAAQPTP